MVFDAFTYFNEADLLELRLSVLDKYVDKFILVESKQTFMGQAKPLYYEENKERFAKWNDKIIHIVAPNIEIKQVPYERHWLCYEMIERVVLSLKPEDIVFCSDLDEIWNPEILNKIDDNPHSLKQYNYTYYLNMRSNEDWTGTLMAKAKNIFVGFNKKNRTDKPYPLDNGGWHFTNCLGRDMIMQKVRAYDHGHEINPKWIEEHIDENIEKGGDYLGRYANYQGEPYRFWCDTKDWPTYLKDNKDAYKHLLKQDDNGKILGESSEN